MPEQSINEEQLPTAAVKNIVNEVNPSTLYVEGRHPNNSISEDQRRNKAVMTTPSQLSDLKVYLGEKVMEIKDQNKKDLEKILMVVQQESVKRTALEQRLHSHLLLQNEIMVAMELKLMRLEAKVERRESTQRQQRLPTPRINAPIFQTIDEVPANEAVISSGASLASGVTAGTFAEDGVVDDNDDAVSQQSTPTLGSRSYNPIAGGNLESILLNSQLGEANTTSQTVRATRGDTDGNSSIGTIITNATLTSNPITGGNLESILLNPQLGEPNTTSQTVRATRGDTDGNSSIGTMFTNLTLTSNPISGGNLESILLNPMVGDSTSVAPSVRATRGDTDGNSSIGTSFTQSTFHSTAGTTNTRSDSIRGVYFSTGPDSRRMLSGMTEDLTTATPEPERRPRSRSNSPLTVGSGASQSTAIMSSVAVAGPRARRALRGETAPDSRPLANRVVSFTATDILPNQPQTSNDNCDSITVPEELDNLSEVADTFASSARAWRDEYEARLDALQKRMANE